ncbi:AbrB/MazE/SpoVT family DNA-binding domain-containing protein [Haloarcula sp. S1AR25-5A]|uniref:AbrB/MazE/SpoVT family DNA-binding domain-containing protein n=1 Tax=Haloarcula terrestris TaxID=2950533 RepID=A0AAE4F085_9EURY|nr:AbrB/MazE/SpoVT family DNA-binding domain-containing protein [Haloarcula terrestris]MDS0222644.1 AbrB/MazE/SpoVT family DNA-binding domain-containing protein [Haloarcula terrestris]
MGTTEPNAESDADDERVSLHVDDRGRITIPKSVRDRLGIEPGTDVSARLSGSVLTVDPKPSVGLETATAGRDSWEETTPTDAGQSLFGPMTDDEQ